MKKKIAIFIILFILVGCSSGESHTVSIDLNGGVINDSEFFMKDYEKHYYKDNMTFTVKNNSSIEKEYIPTKYDFDSDYWPYFENWEIVETGEIYSKYYKITQPITLRVRWNVNDIKDSVLSEDIVNNISKHSNDAFHNESVENSIKFPAKSGEVLVSKGSKNFTQVNYFFEGIFVGTETNVYTGQEMWLVKNENGYVMPVINDAFFDNPEINEVLSIYGKLTGDGYQPKIENVVGETGILFAYKAYTVDGELR